MRRVSSLRDGAPAYPHGDIPDDVLYRHCTDQVPPVVRMKHLLRWTLHRSAPQALGTAPMPRPPRVRHTRRPGDDGALSLLAPVPSDVARTLSEQEAQQVAEAAPILQKVLDDTLRDLNDGLIGISWLRQSRDKEGRARQPHPRNTSNEHAARQMGGMLDQLHKELAAWETYEHAAAQLHAEADELEAQAAQLRESATERRRGRTSAVTSPAADVDEELVMAEEVERGLAAEASDAPQLLWTREDVSDDARRQLGLASSVLAATDELNRAVMAPDRTAAGEQAAWLGTEADPRLDAVELQVDKLQQQVHQLAQLEHLARTYVQRVSARAAHALDERLAAGSATFAGTPTEAQGALATPAAQQRLDTLLAGAHAAPLLAIPPADEAHIQGLDPRQLLRALASAPP